MAQTLEQSIFETLRYFDIFAMPLTTVQIWRSLVIDRDGSGVRWGGQHAWSLKHVTTTLHESAWLRERVVQHWGYFALHRSVGESKRDMERFVREWLSRHTAAQHKLRLTRRSVRLLTFLPLVRMIGISGSLALWNTKPQSDLDLFVIVRRGRIWTARLLLLFATQLLGRRRRYWEGQAPDKICLNHYIADDALTMPVAIRNAYTAMLYLHVLPLTGMSTFRRWREMNDGWLRRWLMFPEAPWIPSRLYARRSVWRPARNFIEGLLLEPAGRSIERWAEQLQRRAIARHERASHHGWGRIMLSDTELAFHPDSKEPAILRAFAEDPGQQILL